MPVIIDKSEGNCVKDHESADLRRRILTGYPLQHYDD